MKLKYIRRYRFWWCSLLFKLFKIFKEQTEFINSIGLSNKKLLEKYKTLIIVKTCNIEYLKPAKLEDKLQIYSSIESFNKASFIMNQHIKKNNDLIVKAKLQLVTVNQEGKPVKIPSVLEKKFNS